MERPLSQVLLPTVCVCICISMRVCENLTLITRIVPLVLAMTAIVIAATFGCDGNRSVMSSGQTVGPIASSEADFNKRSLIRLSRVFF